MSWSLYKRYIFMFNIHVKQKYFNRKLKKLLRNRENHKRTSKYIKKFPKSMKCVWFPGSFGYFWSMEQNLSIYIRLHSKITFDLFTNSLCLDIFNSSECEVVFEFNTCIKKKKGIFSAISFANAFLWEEWFVIYSLLEKLHLWQKHPDYGNKPFLS